MKTYNKCNVEKELTEFNLRTNGVYKNECKKCIKLYNSIYNSKNKERVSQHKKNYYESNKDVIKEKVMDRYNNLKNDEEFLEKNRINGRINCKKHRDNNKEKISKRIKERKLNDPLFKLTDSIRTLLWVSINKMGFSKNGRTQEILGCSFEEFKIYIENLFQEGMSWDNHGDWHLDHKTPISWATNEEEVYELNKYKNFQPLLASENYSKGNRYSH